MPDFLVVALLTGVLGLAGCAPGISNRSPGSSERPPAQVVVVEPEPDPEQAQAAEIRRQKSEIAQLREQLEVDRSRSDAATARAEAQAREAQTVVRALQAEMAEVRARADAAAAQSDQALSIATEFLSNLVAAREEQRIIVERNLKTVNELDQRLSGIEVRVSETDKQRRAQLAQTNTRSSDLELKLQQSDQDLAQLRAQLAALYRESEETRAAMDSGPMLRMLRDLEATQRDTAVLRGLLEEMQREQIEAQKRLQNYYLDLDARIQALQAAERASDKDGPDDVDENGGLAPESFSVPGKALDENSGALSGELMQSGELGKEAGELLESFDSERQRQGAESSPASEVDAVPGIVSTIDTVPVVPESLAVRTNGKPGSTDEVIRKESMNHESVDAPAQGSVDSQVVLDNDDAREKAAGTAVQYVTAHGLIITDWAANVRGQTPGSPGQ